MEETPLDYGNWIRKKNLLVLGLSTIFVGPLIFVPLGTIYRIIVAVLFMILLISTLLPLYAYVLFSQRGGRFQEKIYRLIIQRLGIAGKGRILDIGSGNGVLAVNLAQENSEAEVVGIDYWGKDWEYSKGVCEQNARAAGVEGRVHFQKDDAAALGFATAVFDGAISNLTFHEVKSVANKREVLQEALRVLKPGGSFAFVDYFYDAKYYGKAADFEAYLKELKLSRVECKSLGEMMTVPFLLRHPKVLGLVGMIYGRK